jgi:exonuclease SbcD
MVRILHTSDWHLGATLEGISRDEEHRRFLEWLVNEIRAGGDDILVVAGDVFDQAQPSAEAQRAYYRFLTSLRSTGLRQVVIVGGNHDSPSRLEAPRDLLETLRIHVVGGLAGDPDAWDRCLCRVQGDDGRALAVVAAVPYVHECHLGIQTALADEGVIRTSFQERVAALYRALADRAEQMGDGAPLMATGHLACVGIRPGDAPVEIHRIGSLDGLPPEVFDARFRHVALGHLHRLFRVKESPAWYSGTPVPLGLAEAASPRQVLRVEIPDGAGEAVVTKVPVPLSRQVLEVAGTLDEVAGRLRQMEWDGDLPPYILARVRVDHYALGIETDVMAAAAARGPSGPVLVRVTQDRALSAMPGDSEPVQRSLRDLAPEEVFVDLCRDRGVGDDPDLMQAYRSLLAQEVEG